MTPRTVVLVALATLVAAVSFVVARLLGHTFFFVPLFLFWSWGDRLDRSGRRLRSALGRRSSGVDRRAAPAAGAPPVAPAAAAWPRPTAARQTPEPGVLRLTLQQAETDEDAGDTGVRELVRIGIDAEERAA